MKEKNKMKNKIEKAYGFYKDVKYYINEVAYRKYMVEHHHPYHEKLIAFNPNSYSTFRKAQTAAYIGINQSALISR